jgi:hypothetical protein
MTWPSASNAEYWQPAFHWPAAIGETVPDGPPATAVRVTVTTTAGSGLALMAPAVPGETAMVSNMAAQIAKVRCNGPSLPRTRGS